MLELKLLSFEDFSNNIVGVSYHRQMNKGKLLLAKSSHELVKPFIIVKVMVVMETDGNEEYYVCFC